MLVDYIQQKLALASRNPALDTVIRSEGGNVVLANRLLSSTVTGQYAEHICQPSRSTQQEETSANQQL